MRANFADALAELASEGVRADLLYMDLGISSLQLDAAERGFSYTYDAPLDMRMDPEAGPLGGRGRQRVAPGPAGRDHPRARRGAPRAIDRARDRLAAAPWRPRPTWSRRFAPRCRPAYRFGRGHPAKRTFQAIRIAVNEELDSLDRALPAAWELLREGGRLGAISFHSLEDRRIKRFLADRARGCVCPPELPVCRCGRQPEAEPLTRRALSATPEEVERNPRSHSARLRAARKLHRGSARDDEEMGA